MRNNNNNNNNDDDIIDAIKDHVDRIRKNVARAIKDVDVPTLARYSCIGVIGLLIVVALAVGGLALVGKVLDTLLGKIFSVPLVLLVIGLVYDGFFSGSRKAHQTERNGDALERWAGQVYFYVRDSIYYVFRAVARRTNIQMPDDPTDIEMRNQFFCQGGHIVFQFYAQVLGTQDKTKFEQKLMDTIIQLHKDGRFVGLSEELVEVNGRLYCPLQVLNVEEHDGGFVVQIVFADEETIPLVERSQERQRKSPGKTLYDDEP